MSTVTAMRRSNPWVTRALGMRGIETQEVEGDGDIQVAVDTVYFTDHGPRSNHRPALHIRGRIVGLTPYDTPEIAYGVTEVSFDDQTEGGVPVVDAFYEFTDEQLTVLVGKGYFNEGFEPPSDLVDQVWTLPARYQALVIAPETENDAPLVFIDIIDREGLLIDSEVSGLDLSDYFPDYLSELRDKEARVERTVQNPLERTSQIDDVFAGMVMDEYEADEDPEGRTNEAEGSSISQMLSSPSLPTMSTPLFDALMNETRAKYAQQEAEGEEPDASQDENAIESKDTQAPGASTSTHLTRTELGESFASVMGEFITRSVSENTPDLEGLADLSGTDAADTAEADVSTVDVGDVDEAVDRAEERKRVRVREAEVADSTDDFESLDLGEDEPEF